MGTSWKPAFVAVRREVTRGGARTSRDQRNQSGHSRQTIYLHLNVLLTLKTGACQKNVKMALTHMMARSIIRL